MSNMFLPMFILLLIMVHSYNGQLTFERGQGARGGKKNHGAGFGSWVRQFIRKAFRPVRHPLDPLYQDCLGFQVNDKRL